MQTYIIACRAHTLGECVHCERTRPQLKLTIPLQPTCLRLTRIEPNSSLAQFLFSHSAASRCFDSKWLFYWIQIEEKGRLCIEENKNNEIGHARNVNQSVESNTQTERKLSKLHMYSSRLAIANRMWNECRQKALHCLRSSKKHFFQQHEWDINEI